MKKYFNKKLIMSEKEEEEFQLSNGHVHEELPPMLQIEKPSKSFFWDKIIINREISKKIGENLCFNGRTGVRRLKMI